MSSLEHQEPPQEPSIPLPDLEFWPQLEFDPELMTMSGIDWIDNTGAPLNTGAYPRNAPQHLTEQPSTHAMGLEHPTYNPGPSGNTPELAQRVGAGNALPHHVQQHPNAAPMPQVDPVSVLALQQ